MPELKTYAATYPVDQDGTIQIPCLQLGKVNQIYYDAYQADVVYDNDMAQMDHHHPFYNVWNKKEELFERYETLGDATQAILASRDCAEQFAYLNYPHLDDAKKVCALTQTFFWFEWTEM